MRPRRADGKVFFGTLDDFAVALDRKTGREVWKISVDDPKQCGCNITTAPLMVKDKVIVGGTGGDAAHRGYLGFDQDTCKIRSYQRLSNKATFSDGRPAGCSDAV